MSTDFPTPGQPVQAGYRVQPVHPGQPSTPTPASAPTPTRPASAVGLIVPLLIGGLVATGLGVYGRLHEPANVAVNLAGFSGPLTVKVWLGTLAATLAVVQLFTALVMYGKIPLKNVSWLGGVHR